MTRHSIMRYLPTTAFAFALAACGGGGGGSSGSGFASTPPPAPPPPPPPQYHLVKIFPDVTQSTDFAAIGYENAGWDSTVSQLIGEGFTVRYDANALAYVIDLPSATPGRFGAASEDANFWHGMLLDAGSVNASILKPDNATLDFVYTTFGDYYQYEWGGPIFDGAFAFGQATPASAIPVTGSASYSALLLGRTLDWSHDVTGTASLQFNFGAGTLTGYLEPTLIGGMNPTALGRYDFVNTIYGVGHATFSGGLKHTTYDLTGTFNGLFTGPAAQELMGRWIAQYRDPLSATSETKDMFGVLVGKKP